jgi:threonine synthase
MDQYCQQCGHEYPGTRETPWNCRCDNPLDYVETASPTASSPTEFQVDPSEGIWAFDEFIPVGKHISFGEGFTPEVQTENWNATFKLEYINPTASFKDRGTTVMLSAAVDQGIDRVAVDSSGNAGSALAQYAAHAGISAIIYAPAGISEAKIDAIESTGADIVLVEGPRHNVTEACIEAATSESVWYASHAWRPSFLAGTKTVALEIARHRDWDVPDAVVTPFAAGTLLLGVYRGFKHLVNLGWVDEIPRLFGVQAAGYAPIVAELGGDPSGDNTLVSRIANPPRKDQIIESIADTNGDAVAVTARETSAALRELHRHGFYIEPTAALGPAALRILQARDILSEHDDIVVPLTGSGLKA